MRTATTSPTTSGPRLLRDDPDAIRAVHRRFFAAGADFATIASYQVSYDGFARRGMADADHRHETPDRIVTLAREAAQETDRVCYVAASVGPYGAYLADGSEYRGRYGRTKRQLSEWHQPRLDTLLEAEPDLLAIETIPDITPQNTLATRITGTTHQPRPRKYHDYELACAAAAA